MVKHVLKDKFYQLLWRPRPPTLLSKEKLDDIKNNISRTEKINKEKDKEKRKQQMEEFRRKRQLMRKEFEEYLHQKEDEYNREKDLRMKLLNGPEDEDEEDVEYREEWIEEIEDLIEIPVENH